MPQRIVANGDTQLAIRDSGGEGVPVVFLSGGPGLPDYLADVASMVNGRRVVTYDQRGTGASSAVCDDYSVAAHVSDLDCIRRALGVDRMHLFGHSWGALLAVLYATDHLESVASLFLCGPSLGVGKDWISLEWAVMGNNLRRGSVIAAMQTLVSASLGQIPGRFGAIYLRKVYARAWLNFQVPGRELPASAEMLAGIGQRTAIGIRVSVLAMPKSRLDEVLPTSSLPIHVVIGENDALGQAGRRLAQRYPRASFELWSDCGHLPWVDQGARLKETLNDFYRDLD